MAELNDLRTYHDIKSALNTDIFTRTMTYVAWHNRLPMTHLLEIWQALVVGFALQRREIPFERFLDVKDYLLFDGHHIPENLAECRKMAEQLAEIIDSSTKK